MLSALLNRIIGSKVIIGALLAATLASTAASTWLWYSNKWSEEEAREAKANAKAWKENSQAREMELSLLEELTSSRQNRLKEQAKQLENTQDALQAAKSKAPKEVRNCLDVRLPSDIVDRLRVTPSRTEKKPPSEKPD